MISLWFVKRKSVLKAKKNLTEMPFKHIEALSYMYICMQMYASIKVEACDLLKVALLFILLLHELPQLFTIRSLHYSPNKICRIILVIDAVLFNNSLKLFNLASEGRFDNTDGLCSSSTSLFLPMDTKPSCHFCDP